MDTAWLWPMNETIRKAARTVSNAVNLMKQFPEYRFIQSSVLHTYWLEKYYPDIFEDVKHFVKEGRTVKSAGFNIVTDRIQCLKNKQSDSSRLLAFGIGDGGGGPTEYNIIEAEKTRNIDGLPEINYTSVSDFAKRLEAKKDRLPVYSGELYLELHRGGCRPDVSGDFGVHELTYSLLPHSGAFSVNNTVKPAYELNLPLRAVEGLLKGDAEPIAKISADNIICESLKPAENKYPPA